MTATISHGCSFETSGGLWRKEVLTADLSDWTEAPAEEPYRTVYGSLRLEQRMLALRLTYGNVDQSYYATEWARLEALAEGYLTAGILPPVTDGAPPA